MRERTHYLNGLSVFTYSFELMDSRMYMIREENEILVVDPCIDDALLDDACGVIRATVILTHEHFDHISGVNWLKQHFVCVVYAGSVCARRIQSSKENFSSSFPFLFLSDREKFNYVKRNIDLPYTCNADRIFSGMCKIAWKNHELECSEVGGHSPGSCLIVLDHMLLFAGDNVIGNGRELWGLDVNRDDYYHNVLPALKKLGGEMMVLPGHGECDILAAFWNRLPHLER